MRFFCPRRKQLRLRVIAHSDGVKEQEMKGLVRDAVLPLALRRPLDMAAIRETAKRIDPTAVARYGRLYFGGYRSPAVEIKLGAGAGRNWWGILYPEAMEADGPVRFESWILTLLRKWGWIG